MLILYYTSDLVKGADSFAIHEKRPREDSHPWNVAWPSDSHRRLEIFGRQQGRCQLDEWRCGGQGNHAQLTLGTWVVSFIVESTNALLL